jgi:hypothetical protein
MMRPILVIAGIVLILLSLQLGSVQAAHCTDVFVDAQGVELSGNSTEYFYVPIYNDGSELFVPREVRVYREDADSPFTLTVSDYSDEIEADGKGEIELRVVASGVDDDETGTAYIKIRGYLGDEYCSFGEIEDAYFDVTVSTESTGTPSCGNIHMYASDVFIDENSAKTVSFTIENTSNKSFNLDGIEVSENSTYFDASIYSKPASIGSNRSETSRVRIEANQVSADRQGSVALRAKGSFSNGTYCHYDDSEEESFTVNVENIGTQPSPQPQLGNECQDIALDKHIVRAAQGETVYTTFQLRNFVRENFLVDYISIFDGSNNFKAEQNGYAKIVPASGSAFVNAKVQAYDFAVPGSRENAFVEVKGHFQNQESCSLSGNGLNTFEVIIEEKEAASFSEPAEFAQEECSLFSLIAPVSMKIDGNGSVPIVIVNKAYSRATILLYGPGLSITPSFISVAENSTISEDILVESKLPQSTLVFTVDTPLCKTEKRTVIINSKAAASATPAAPAAQPVPINPVDGAIKGVQGAMAAGFAVLNQNLALVGLVILVAIILFFILKE